MATRSAAAPARRRAAISAASFRADRADDVARLTEGRGRGRPAARRGSGPTSGRRWRPRRRGRPGRRRARRGRRSRPHGTTRKRQGRSPRGGASRLARGERPRPPGHDEHGGGAPAAWPRNPHSQGRSAPTESSSRASTPAPHGRPHPGQPGAVHVAAHRPPRTGPRFSRHCPGSGAIASRSARRRHQVTAGAPRRRPRRRRPGVVARPGEGAGLDVGDAEGPHRPRASGRSARAPTGARRAGGGRWGAGTGRW